ncbi:MAG: hypothetical protein LIO65_04695 [Odoribacter sp.]|nr:hypothetical protein [Odoribacter sp.]
MEHGGMCYYDAAREVFIREPIAAENPLLSINQILEDKEGILWLATSEGLMYKDKSKAESEVVNLHLNLRSSHIKRILIDSYSNMWIGTNKGLYLYNPKNSVLTPFPFPDTRYVADEIWTLYEDSFGKIWIGTYNSGLYYINPSDKKLVKSSFEPDMQRSQTIRSILEEEDGTLWLGTRAGLYSYDGEKYIYYPLSADNEEFSSLNSILSLYKDKKGDLWIGSRHGLAYLVQEKQFVRSYRYSTQEGDYLNNGEVYAFLCDGNQIWIGTEQGGINLLDRKTGKYTYFTTENSALTSNCIKAFLRVEDQLWIGTFMGGISIMDMKTRKIVRHYLPRQNDSSSISDNKIWSMFRDRNGNIWIGTGRGIDQYDETTDSFIHRQDILWDEQVNWINQDEDGDLWFGGENVLVIYTPSSKAIKNIIAKRGHLSKSRMGLIMLLPTTG